MHNYTRKVLIVVLYTVLFATTAKGQLPSETKIQAPLDIDLISRATVQIDTQVSTGSGTIIFLDNQFFVVTNRHVVEGFERVTVKVLDDINEPAVPAFIAELVKYSPDFDVALLKIISDNENQLFSTDELRDSIPDLNFFDQNNELRRGEVVSILGFPGIGQNELVYSQGIISSIKMEEVYGERIPVWIRTNADMSPGSSGGLALDGSGNVIGMPTYVRTESTTGGRLGSILTTEAITLALNAENTLSSWDDYNETIAGAGETLDFTAEAAFGSTSLRAGSFSSPHVAEIISGGGVDVSYLGGECIGFADSPPDYSINWSGSAQSLQILFTALNEGDDTTLIINSPEGEWYCNDDFNELNPGLSFNTPAEGRYDIWVGSYHPGEFVDGVLSVTEDAPDERQSSDMSLVWSANPHYGDVSLAPGFLPDPHSVEIMAGGNVNVRMLDLGTDCTGFAASAPDYRLLWGEGTQELSFYFEANSPGDDTVLIISAPDGSWHCNDDANSLTLDPKIMFSNPLGGQYDIWVATFSDGGYINGRLYISELESEGDHPEYSESGDLVWSADPTFGQIVLESGFLPDPHIVPMTSGGEVDVSRLNYGSDCVGYAASEPDFRLQWSSGAEALYIYFEAESSLDDTVLIISGPDGTWYCNDDAGLETLNPMVYFLNPAPGQYDIWVASFNIGEFHDGRLLISELD